MRYMLWMVDDGSYEPGPEEIEAMPAFVAWEQKMAGAGIEHRGERLRPLDHAVTVRVRDGERLVTDGPFADTKEHIGGFEITEDDFTEWRALAGARKLEGHALARTSDATTVRDNGRLITDGPFAETGEQVAGYDILECDSTDEAVDLAARHPVAAVGAIEVRPFWSN